MMQNKIQVESTKKAPRLIGITGGIGSGKSEVSKYLISLGYPLIDADLISREVVEPGEIGLMHIVEYFGESILNNDHTLNRRKLGEMIFNNVDSRVRLNEILHPRIEERIEQLIKFYINEKFVFIDVPLLFETESKSKYDEVLLVYASEEVCLNRVIKRDGVSRDFALKKIKAQMSIELKRAMADYIITNNENDIISLHLQVEGYLHEIQLNYG